MITKQRLNNAVSVLAAASVILFSPEALAGQVQPQAEIGCGNCYGWWSYTYGFEVHKFGDGGSLYGCQEYGCHTSLSTGLCDNGHDMCWLAQLPVDAIEDAIAKRETRALGTALDAYPNSTIRFDVDGSAIQLLDCDGQARATVSIPDHLTGWLTNRLVGEMASGRRGGSL